ncbi:MAG: ornithine carbamoyltransferase [Deltaproteobacteria bacterium]|nr:ornithine carbamoyltransferase [Deltaproteobacteria bacterium]
MTKDLLSIADLTRQEVDALLARAAELKVMLRRGARHQPLVGKTLGMIFAKPSTRTRVSFEVAMVQLGGAAIFLSTQDLQLGRGETIADTARVLSGYLDGIMIRTFAQADVEELARWASVPVINGLTDLTHPCQILADLLTITEHRGGYEQVKVAYVGDGNNVCHSWLLAAGLLGFELAVACPAGYRPDPRMVERARALAAPGAPRITLTEDPFEAVKDAGAIYTDTWASMGQEQEHEARVRVFRPYQVNRSLVEAARGDALVMHCLPAHRGEEITDEVMDGPRSVVFPQAENRLHLQKAVLERLLGGR